jgi:hypothetical protein
MATAKNKKQVKVRDLKPSKDAKGGARSSTNSAQRNSALGGNLSGKGGTTFGASGKLN